MEFLKAVTDKLQETFGPTINIDSNTGGSGTQTPLPLQLSQITEHIHKISGGKFKGGRYCDTIITLAKKFDMFNLVKDHHIRRICKEVSFVNKMLNVTYDIIFRQGLNRHDAIQKMLLLRDRDKHKFIDPDGANQIYQKFQELSNQINKGATEKPVIDLENLPPSVGIRSGGGRRKGKTTNKRRRRKVVKGGASDSDSDSDSKDTSDDEDDNMDTPVKNNLSEAQRRTVDKTFDMMEIVLICLSLLPLAGWTFDFPLLIYSLIKQKYTLSMITVLNWFIWAGWLCLGIWVNLGPTMKASYLGNRDNLVKKSLLYPTKATSKIISPYTVTKPVVIDGRDYLVDGVGNLFSAEIQSPTMIGILNDQRKIVKKGDDDYEETLRQLKHSKHKKKIGPTDLV